MIMQQHFFVIGCELFLCLICTLVCIRFNKKKKRKKKEIKLKKKILKKQNMELIIDHWIHRFQHMSLIEKQFVKVVQKDLSKRDRFSN